MLTPRPGPIAVAIGAVVVLVLFVASALHYRPEEAAHYGSKIFGGSNHKSSADQGLESVWNETLGVSRSISVPGVARRRLVKVMRTATASVISDRRLTCYAV